MEEYVWLLEQHSTRMAIVCAEVEGSTTLADWQHALRLLEMKYDVLSTRVKASDGVRPFFCKAEAEGIPLHHRPLTPTSDILTECREVMKTGFGDGGGPPLRVTLLLGANRAAAIFSGHHAFFDGIGLMNLIRDTLSFLTTNNEPSTQEQSPSVDMLVGLDVGSDFLPRNDGSTESRTAPSDVKSASVTSDVPQIGRIELSTELTRAIVVRAREHDTTANGVIMASALSVGRAIGEPWMKNNVTCVVPVNVRPLFHREQAEGIVFGQKRFVFNLLRPPEFWDIARSVSTGVKEVRTRAGLLANLQPLHDFLASQRTVEEAVALASAHTHDLMISNFGTFEEPTQFGQVRLRSLIPVVNSGDENTQTLMVATTADIMTIVLVSPNPLPGYLENLQSHLIKTCL